MHPFDLEDHYNRAGKATTPELVAEIKLDFSKYYNSLTESEQATFRAQLEEHARQQAELAKGQIAFLKRILAEQSAPV